MFSQLIVIILNHSLWFLSSLLVELDTTSRALFKIMLAGYGFWNLDYFCYLILPFCVSQDLKNIHVFALQYVICLPFIHCYPLRLHTLIFALSYMDTTSDQLSGYGNHFTDVVSALEEGGIQKHPLLMSLPHFLFCLTLSFCLCQPFFSKGQRYTMLMLSLCHTF